MESINLPLKSPNLFQLHPSDKLCFSLLQADSPCLIKIKNISNSDIAFKVKSNAPKFYLVSPSRGVIKLGQTQALKVNLRGQSIEENHSFMILGQRLADSSNLDKIWQNPKNCQKSKLKVCSTPSEPTSVKSIADENCKLEKSLTEVIEELKSCRIKTLKHNCEHDREFSYIHGALTFVTGLIFGLVCPALFN